ncbi:hypothetical protein SAMN02745975_00311 [Geosporobacter subterraneus DSM 17957]|uniref:Uncharacterized protein n=1 Tax=Geosporobacter subterraneus DSM 17957 TaxID=1121919 RepID=A0A1M6CSB4_9FIRM|nr:hypothetical protein [Geosporobacter subterraneus]SHI63849.1 hypothetical protein SAMN02745975_00311 [Geosporobacter subterraneus DSM 17957]
MSSASRDQLHAIASQCSKFRNVYRGGLQSATFPSQVTCEHCGHFTEDHRCELDLIDEILVNMDQT